MTAAPTSVPTDHETSSDRVLNFSAGPATMPEEVLRQAQQDIWNIRDSGVGIIEHSHRGSVFSSVLEEAIADCRTLADVDDSYDVVFVQGGATLQFAMIPMNFLPEGRTADYLDTGVWATKAIQEARQIGNVHVAFDGSANGYDHVPDRGEINLSSDPAYVHYCSNNTIYGTQFGEPPAVSHDLIADCSSDMFSRPIDVSRHAMVYAGAQKNLGPAGVVLVIVRKDLLDSAKDGLPSLLSYKQIAAKESCLNTPPTFSIYFMGQVFKWILRNGGLEAMAERNEAKARVVYDAIDSSGDFYTGVAKSDCRSLMNISFRTPSEDLDAKFVKDAASHGMSGLKGHRDAGGLRASVYNAFPHHGCETLAQFLRDFAIKNG